MILHLYFLWHTNIHSWGSTRKEASFQLVRVCMCSHSVVSNSLHPMDCSPPGSFVHGILQARILKWVVLLSSRGSSRPRDQAHASYVPCISRRFCFFFFFTTSATCEAISLLICFLSVCLPDENMAAWAWTLAHEVYGSIPKSSITFEISQQTLNIHLLNWWICEWINKYVNPQLIATVWRANYQKIISVYYRK